MKDEAKLVSDQETKPWMCPSGKHAMGYVIRNGGGVRRMLLLREAITLNEGSKQAEELSSMDQPEKDIQEMAEVDVMAVVEGYVMNVRCSLCGRMRTWVPGEEAIKRLVEDYKERNQSPLASTLTPSPSPSPLTPNPSP